MLNDLFAVSSTWELEHDATTPISTRITGCLMADIEPRIEAMLKKKMRKSEDHEIAMRRHTEAQLDEDLDNHKLDVKNTMEEGLAELQEKFESLKQQLIDVGDAKAKKMAEGMQELVDERLMDVEDDLKGLVKENKPSLEKMVRKILDAQSEGSDRRATSSPL